MQVIKALDSRLQLSSDHTLIAVTGATNQNCVKYNVNSVSNSGVVIQFNPPSELTGLDANVLLNMSFDIVINGTNTSAQPLCMPNLVGPAYLPITKIITGHSLQINNASVQLQNPNLYLPIILSNYDGSVDGGSDASGEGSMTPSFPDQSSSFLLPPIAYTSVRNPLATSIDQCYSSTTPRGAFIGWNTVSNVPGATTSHFTLDCCEPVRITPLKSGSGSFSEACLTYINGLLYNASIANLNRVVSIAYPPDPITDIPTYSPIDLVGGSIGITSIQVNVTKAQLTTVNYTFQPSVPRPMSLIRSYNEITDYNTSNYQPLAPGASTTVTLSNQVLNSVPLELFIFFPCMPDSVIQTTNPSSCCYPDACLMMGGGGGFLGGSTFPPLSINFDNSAQMQNFSSFDLYKICKKNGVTKDFSQFMGLQKAFPYSDSTGMVLRLRCGEDICLNPGVFVGQQGKFSLTVQASAYNQTQRTLPATVLHVVVVSDGYTAINEGLQAQNVPACFSANELDRIPLDPNFKFKPVNRRIFGGSFWDTLRSVFGPINEALKSSKIISKHLAPSIPRAGPAIAAMAQSLGYGEGYRRRPAASRRGGVVFE